MPDSHPPTERDRFWQLLDRYSREYPIAKLLRDARASTIEDGCNDVLSLVGADRL
jgi:alkylation response protein AidB-like acyl-CoA dehydrogenase